MKSSKQIQGVWKAAYFCIFSFIVSLLSPIQISWADVGPVAPRQPQTQQQLAPTTTSVPRRAVQEAEETGAPGQGATGAWFEDLHNALTYENFEIHPRVRTEYVLDSNVLLESGDERMDSIFREVPGVEIIMPFQDHYLKADYHAELEQYMKVSEENRQNQYLKSELSMNFTDLYIFVTEGLTHTSSRSGTTFTERIPRFEHTVDPKIGYKFNRFTVEAGYGNFFRSFDTSREKTLNYRTHKWSGNIAMDVTAKTKAFGEYIFTDYDYANDSTRDANGHQFFGGVKGALFPKTTLYSKFGYERVDLDLSGETDSDNFVSEVGFEWEPAARTGVDFGWKRSTQQSTYATTNFFTEDKLFASLRQEITEKLSASAGVSYTNQDYEEIATAGPGIFVNGERNDDIIALEAKLTYRLNDWVSTDIKYQYARRDSNAFVFDYTDHLVAVGLGVEV